MFPNSATVANLQQKLEVVQADNCLMKEDLAISKNNVLTLQSEVDRLLGEKNDVTFGYEKKMEVSGQKRGRIKSNIFII